MHKFFIDSSYLVGKPKGGNWSGVSVSSEKSKRSQELGQLFVVMSLKAPNEFNSKVAGDFLLRNIQDVFYGGGKSINQITRIEKAIMSTAKRLEYLLQREKVAAEKGIDLNITTVLVKDAFIYMAILGEGSILLFRNNTLIDLTVGLKDLSGRDLIKSGSGKIREEDKFVLLSERAVMKISEGEIKNSLKSFDLESIENRREDPLLGLLMIGFSGAKKKVKELETGLGEDDLIAQAASRGELEKVDLKSMDEKEKDHDEEERQALPSKEEKEKEEVGEEESTVGPLEAEEIGEESKLKSVKDFGSKVKDKLRDKATYQVLLLKLRDFLIKGYQLLKTYIWEGLMGMGRKGLYIRGSGPKGSMRGIVILIVLTACLLYLSIRGIQRHKERSTKVDDVQNVLSQIDEKFDNGRNLGEAGNIAEAVSILEEAMGQLEEAKSHGVLLDKLEAKEGEVLGILDEVRRVFVVTDSNIITDVAGYIEGGGANDLAIWEGGLYISDMNNSAIYEVGFDGGEVKRLVGGDTPLSAPNSLVFDSDGNILLSDLEKGILKVTLNDNKVVEIAGLSASSVGEIAEVDNYTTPDGSNFLYLLRANNNDVRKVSRYPSGYSMPALRLADSRFAGASDMEIDGKIYILTQSEGVLRYFVDNPDPYTIVGLDKPISSSNCLELDDKLVYLGDRSLERVVVITKGSYLAPQQGKYVAQFEYRGDGDYFSDIREIVVDNDARLMFVLAGTKIFKMELNEVDQYAEKLE